MFENTGSNKKKEPYFTDTIKILIHTDYTKETFGLS